MSYYIQDPGPGGKRGFGKPGVIAGVVVVLLLVVVAFFVGRGGTEDESPTSPGAPKAADPITWSMVGGEPAPASAKHGPRQTTNGLAAGFSHDELGAVLAAVNISYRLTSDAGPLVYETTARQQCYGDVNTAIAQIRSSPVSAGTSTATELYYKVMSGDPAGDLVLISVAVKSAETTAAGGYAAFQRTLRWTGNDWQLQVPAAPAQLVADVSNYRFLGRPDV